MSRAEKLLVYCTDICRSLLYYNDMFEMLSELVLRKAPRRSGRSLCLRITAAVPWLNFQLTPPLRPPSQYARAYLYTATRMESSGSPSKRTRKQTSSTSKATRTKPSGASKSPKKPRVPKTSEEWQQYLVRTQMGSQPELQASHVCRGVHSTISLPNSCAYI